MKRSNAFLFVFVLGFFLGMCSTASAECLLFKKKRGTLKVVERSADGSCAKKSIDLRDVLTGIQANGAVAGLQGPTGPQGEQGPAGPQGAQGPAGQTLSDVVNITPISAASGCNGGPASYSGQGHAAIYSSPTFQKFENDSILEITFTGRFSKPSSMVGNALLSLSVGGQYGQSGTGTRIIYNDEEVTQLNALHDTFTAVIGNVPSGTYPVVFDIQGLSSGDSGSDMTINPGCYVGSYLVVREILLP